MWDWVTGSGIPGSREEKLSIIAKLKKKQQFLRPRANEHIICSFLKQM